MNDEQKARLAKLASEMAYGADPDELRWLLALVKELDEENARLARPRATLYSESDIAQALKRAEQQLAAVTTERECVVAALTAAHDTIQVLGRERDELKRGPWVAECLKLRLEKENLQQAALRATAMTAERAETAEKRVAELQALVDAATRFLFEWGTALCPRRAIVRLFDGAGQSGSHWWIDAFLGEGGSRIEAFETRDKAIARVRELAAKESK